MRFVKMIATFVRLVFSKQRPVGRLEDSPELVRERESFRGMRGDAM